MNNGGSTPLVRSASTIPFSNNQKRGESHAAAAGLRPQRPRRGVGPSARDVTKCRRAGGPANTATVRCDRRAAAARISKTPGRATRASTVRTGIRRGKRVPRRHLRRECKEALGGDRNAPSSASSWLCQKSSNAWRLGNLGCDLRAHLHFIGCVPFAGSL